MADDATRTTKARIELLQNYSARLIDLFGPHFEDHPRFQAVIKEVASGRAPEYVFMDVRGL